MPVERPDADFELDELLRGFRAPPAADGDRLWPRIEASIPARRVHRFRLHRWRALRFGAPLLAAAVVATIIVMAPASRDSGAPEPVPPRLTGALASPAPVAQATREHLAQIERFLSPILALPGPGAGRPAAADSVGGRATSLLAQTEVLLASRSPAAAAHAGLLEDVELVLAQLAADPADAAARAENVEFAAMTATHRAVLPRLQAARGGEGSSE